MNRRYLPYLILFILSVAIVASLCRPGKKTPVSKQYENEKKILHDLAGQLDTAFWQNCEDKLQLTEQAITLSKQINDNEMQALFLYLKSNFLFQLEMYDSLEYYTKAAIGISAGVGNKLIKARAHSIIANYHLHHTGNYYDAFLHFQDVLKLSEQLELAKGLAVANNGIGMIYEKLSDPGKALLYYKKASDYFQEEGDMRNMALVSMNMGNCYSAMKQYDDAIGYHNKALHVFREIKDSLQIAGEFVNLGTIYSNLKQYRKALEYLRQAEEYSRNNHVSLLSVTLKTFGYVYMELNHIGRAKENLTESLNLSKNIGRKSDEAEVLLQLSEIAEKEGNTSLSYRYYKSAVQLKESLIGAETQKRIAETQAMYNLRKQEYETQLIQKRYQLKAKQNTILVLSLASSLIIIVLFATVLRLKNRDIKKNVRLAELEKMQHQTEMEARNKELVTSSLQLTVKNDILQKISGLSDKIGVHKEINPTELKRELYDILKHNYNVDNDWAYFKKMFEQVYIDFFDKIKLLGPNLSENELRVCAYIKINLQCKEIAKIMNIHPKSVIKSRYRIRKKLNLEKDDGLEDFIRTI